MGEDPLRAARAEQVEGEINARGELAQTIDYETRYYEIVTGGPDAPEGPIAWIERRPPNWSLRVGDEWPRVLAAETPDKG